MNTHDLAPAVAPDEIVELLLNVARRADELRRRNEGEASERDFWREAEAEVWSGRAAGEVENLVA